MISEFLNEIADHFEKEYPGEGCGVIAVRKGRLCWIPCKNIAKDNEDFVFDSSEYLKIRRTHDVVGIVHSHPDCSNEPSPTDIKYCNSLGLPYYIFSYPSMDLHVQYPEVSCCYLYGQPYDFGKNDCFEAARKYLASENIHIPARAAFEDDWWEKGLNYFCEDLMNEWGFKKVPLQEAQKNDILLFQSDSVKVPDHCGVYLGNEVFYHHAVNRLSCRESLHPLWIQFLKEAYRYET